MLHLEEARVVIIEVYMSVEVRSNLTKDRATQVVTREEQTGEEIIRQAWLYPGCIIPSV